MKRYWITLAALSVMLTMTCEVAIGAEKKKKMKPRLAIMIVVDGLQTYQLETFLPEMEDGGLKRITENGIYYERIGCTYMPSDEVTDVASLMTGTSPRFHGIVGSRFFSLLDDDKTVSCVEDARFDGINSLRTVSPRLLMANTIGDELKMAYPASKVYALGLTAESAVMMGGHLADGAVWMDDESGLIATSGFYNNGLPRWATKMNADKRLSEIGGKNWEAMYEEQRYRQDMTSTHPDAKMVLDSSREGMSTQEWMKYAKQTPAINDLVKEMAIRTIRDEQMGTDDNPDLICVEFSVRNKYSSTPFSGENEDMFLWLDRTVKQFFDAVDLSVGLENCVVTLTSPHYFTTRTNKEDKRLQHGTFNSHRATALLNGYLMALYGQGRWVTAYNQRNISLNKKLIEDQGLRLSEVEERAAEFMMEFSGVHSSISASKLQTLSGGNEDYPALLRNSHFKNRSGNVILTLMPGWSETDKNDRDVTTPTSGGMGVPLVIWTDDMNVREEDIRIEDIAPTICNLLRIPMPNASTGQVRIIQN